MPAVAYIVIAIAGAAALVDVRTRRIPNVLTFGAALAALVFHIATQGLPGATTAIGGWAVAAALFFAPFALGGMGAGDVKLVAALGA